MSTKLIQALHAGISRRDWWEVEAAANRLRDEIELATRVLAGTGIGSLPNDYPLSELAQAELARLRAIALDLQKGYIVATGLVERAQAIISTKTYPNWHEAARAALSSTNEQEDGR